MKNWIEFNESKKEEIDYDQLKEDIKRVFKENIEIPGNVPLYKSSGKQQTIYMQLPVVRWALKQQGIDRYPSLSERNKIMGTPNSIWNELEKEEFIQHKTIAKFLPWSLDRYGYTFYYLSDISDDDLEMAIAIKEDELKDFNSKFLAKQKEKADYRKEHTKPRRRRKVGK